MLNKVFKPSKSKVLGRGDLMRNDDWSTNGFFAVASVYEPKYLSELKGNEQRKPDIKNAIEKYSAFDLEKLSVTDELSLIGDGVSIKLKGKDFDKYVNVYFLTFFMSLKFVSATFYGNKDADAIVIKNHDDIIGLIMTIRKYD